jgi:hypothetical protein
MLEFSLLVLWKQYLGDNLPETGIKKPAWLAGLVFVDGSFNLPLLKAFFVPLNAGMNVTF